MDGIPGLHGIPVNQASYSKHHSFVRSGAEMICIWDDDDIFTVDRFQPQSCSQSQLAACLFARRFLRVRNMQRFRALSVKRPEMRWSN